jgi:hypothetical protein
LSMQDPAAIETCRTTLEEFLNRVDGPDFENVSDEQPDL